MLRERRIPHRFSISASDEWSHDVPVTASRPITVSKLRRPSSQDLEILNVSHSACPSFVSTLLEPVAVGCFEGIALSSLIKYLDSL